MPVSVNFLEDRGHTGQCKSLPYVLGGGSEGVDPGDYPTHTKRTTIYKDRAQDQK